MIRQGITVAAVLAAITGTAVAGGPDVAPAPSYVGGFYVGVGLSRDDVRDSYRFITRDNAVDINTRRIDAGAAGWDGQFTLGYGYVWRDEYYFGLEAWGDVSSLEEYQFHNTNYDPNDPANFAKETSNLTVPYSAGIAFIPGYYVAPGSLFYARLGYVKSQFNIWGDNTTIPAAVASNPQPTFKRSNSGFHFGVGTDTQVGSHLSIREEYVWEYYDDSSFTTPSLTDQAGRVVFRTIRIEPEMENFNFALIYRFEAQGNAPDLSAAPAHTGGHIYAGLAGSRVNISTSAEYNHLKSGVRETFDPSSPDSYLTTINDINSGVMKFAGFDIQGMLGYGYNTDDRWYVGLEISGDWTSANGRYQFQEAPYNVFNGFNTRLERTWSFGAAVTPGYQVSDHALLYGRIGYIGGDFNTRSSYINYFGLRGFPAYDAVLTRSKSRWLNGCQLGLGVDTLVYDNLSIRMEFDVNNYLSNLDSRSRIASSEATAVQDTSSFKSVREDQFNVAFIWHFYDGFFGKKFE